MGVCVKYMNDDDDVCVCAYACSLKCVFMFICQTEKLRLTQVSVEI